MDYLNIHAELGKPALLSNYINLLMNLLVIKIRKVFIRINLNYFVLYFLSLNDLLIELFQNDGSEFEIKPRNSFE